MKKLSLIENAEENRFSVSEKIVDALLQKKRSDIKITQIFYQNDAVRGKRVDVVGTAPSREVLLLFRNSSRTLCWCY